MRIVCEPCGYIHYQNPRIIVGALVVYQHQVLLCKRAIEPRQHLWNLPAGFMENHETAEEGAAREVEEEALAHIRIRKLHCVFSVPSVNQVYLIYLADLPDPSYGITPESSEVKLFDVADIPWDTIAFTSTAFALEQYIRQPDFSGVHLGTDEIRFTP